MTIDSLISILEDIAPLKGAAEWDNVGLHVRGERPIGQVGLCIDLTESVWDELSGCDAIIAYHPPIFRGLKRLDGRTALDRTLLQVVRAGVHVYAPHTALDAAPGAMGDWLAEAMAPGASLRELRPVQPAAFDPAFGVGRRAELDTPTTLRAMLPRIKSWLGLAHVRVAGDLDRSISSFAVCPGSGGSVLRGLSKVDLLLTGEMGHHEVLAHVAGGGAVVLTDHTNCERGYLPHYAARIKQSAPHLSVRVSSTDQDPLAVV